MSPEEAAAIWREAGCEPPDAPIFLRALQLAEQQGLRKALRVLKEEQRTFHAGPGFTRTRWRKERVDALKNARAAIRRELGMEDSDVG